MLDERRVLDADGHVVEPGHVFDRWTGGRLPMDLPDTTPMVPCGDFELLADQFENGFDAPSYLRAMDAQGIDVAVLYPSIGLFVPYLPELEPAESVAACRSYNDWIAEYCEGSQGRLFGAGILPLADLAAAEDEVSRCAELGLVAMMARPNHLHGRNIGDPALDGVHSTLAGTGLVLAVHEGLGLRGQPTIGSDRFSGFAARHALSHPMEQMAAMASLVLDGAFERHPGLRTAFLESGTGWLPYWLHRLDEHVEWMSDSECSGLSMRASEYFARQCVISTEADDELAPSAVASVGAGHVMWASDFPHPDAVFPGSAREFVNRCTEQGMAADEIDAVLWTTPFDFYKLRSTVAPAAADERNFGTFDSMGQFTDTVAGDVRNPYPDLARKRAESPVELVMQAGFDGQERMTATVYRHDDVSAVLRDNETFSSGAIRDLMGVVMGPYVLVGMDEPEHKRHRRLVSHAFRSKALAHWEDDLIVDVVDELIDSFAADGRAELVRQFTFHFPVQVIAEVLGIPHTDHERFHHYAVAIINVAADPETGIKASESLRSYLSEHVEARRRQPGDDVISDLVTSEFDGEMLDDEEIYSFLRLLLPAGAETTYRSSGNFLFGLLTHPDQLEALAADRTLMTQAVEEAIRWESPLLITSRRSTADSEIGGVTIPADTDVIAHLGSANHDEEHWDDAESFDIHREPKPQIAFGAGPHMCLGMHLARLEMRVAVNRLLDRLPGLRLDPGDDDPHIHGERFRSPTSLPVRF